MAVNFQSERQLDVLRNQRREAREIILEKTKQDYEKRKVKEEQARLRGEDKWMLPELDAKLSSKKEKKKKKKKEKKSKKKRKRDSSCSEESEEEWVEKTVESSASHNEPLKRDEWMSISSLIPTFSKEEVRPQRSSKLLVEESHRKLALENPGQTDRELNPYWKNGGTGLPPEKSAECSKENSDATDETSSMNRASTSKSQSPVSKRSEEQDGRYRSRSNLRERRRYRNKEKSRSRSKSNDRERSYPRVRSPHHRARDEVSKSKPRFRRPSEGDGTVMTSRQYSSRQGWKKVIERPRSPSSSSSSSCEAEDKMEEKKSVEHESGKIWTEQELNALGAKIVKAEILGNQALVDSLKRTLAAAKEQSEQLKKEGLGGQKETTILLTRTDTKGRHHPLPAPRYGEESLKGSKGKRKQVETHESKQRVRYFADDDKYSLNQMFEREKLDTAEDQNAMFARLAGKRMQATNSDFDVDDLFESRANREEDTVAAESRSRQKAIEEHVKREKILDSCPHCLDSKAMQKHLIIAIGSKCYLSLPAHQSLTEGHCFIIPRGHVTCSTQVDEDVWEEIQNFRKALTRLFESRDEDAIFFETAMHLKKFPHMIIECVPLPRTAGDTAPIYFKKAILECESEWSMNKKVIDLKGKDVRRGVPKGLSYFFVDFGLDSGFAHVIEDEQRFPKYFAQEILGGILDLEPQLWRHPRRENFDQQRRKVLEFAGNWKPFDFTAKLKDDS